MYTRSGDRWPHARLNIRPKLTLVKGSRTYACLSPVNKLCLGVWTMVWTWVWEGLARSAPGRIGPGRNRPAGHQSSAAQVEDHARPCVSGGRNLAGRHNSTNSRCLACLGRWGLNQRTTIRRTTAGHRHMAHLGRTPRTRPWHQRMFPRGRSPLCAAPHCDRPEVWACPRGSYRPAEASTALLDRLARVAEGLAGACMRNLF